MKNRITVLLGAGAVIESTDVSTQSLTDAVISNCKKHKLVDKICEVLQNEYSKDAKPNFEDIFHVLELLLGFRSSSGYKGYTSMSSIFAQFESQFADIEPISIFSSARELIETINNEIALYDLEFATKGKKFSNFFDQLINKTGSALDIYSLNYDTWVEQSLKEYNDGYVDIDDYPNMKRFDVSKAFTPSDKHFVSHLHGQICFGHPEFSVKDVNKYAFQESHDTLYKYSNYSIARDYRIRSIRSNDSTQAGENLFRTNIVTGLMKTDKLLWNPLNAYHHKLANSLLNNDQLIIMGYSFSDYYINNLLILFNAKHYNNRKVVIIDYISPKNWQPQIQHPFSPNNKALFTNYIAKEDRWYSSYMFKDFDTIGLLFSGNGDLCICKDGFHTSLNHMDEILQFINP